MNRALVIILLTAFLVSGCASNPSSTQTLEPIQPSIESSTATQTVTQVPTNTLTSTPFPAVTLTPLLTATFDPTTIVTSTPAAAAQCPEVVAGAQIPKFPEPDWSVITFRDNEQKALEFLNQGGKPEDLIQTVKASYGPRVSGQIKDITGDGVAEVIVSPSETYVFGCSDGKYKILLKVDNEGIAINGERNRIVAIEDMNLDGIPELIVVSYAGAFAAGIDGWIYEWDGERFVAKAQVSMDGRQTSGDPSAMAVKNTNDDPLLELMITGGIGIGANYYDFFPWREETDTYAWNGNEFALQNTAFSKPQFRYQVVQDADRAAVKGDYDQAIRLYQNAIFGNYDWFSAERKQYFRDSADPNSKAKEPAPDPNEKVNLAGYSFFKVMVTYAVAGDIQEAQTAYERIRKNYAKGFPGYDYAILSDAFWNEYQSSQDMGKACGKAIEYAADHTDLLKYLGSNYHNLFQDTIYKPEDVCPFK